MKRNVKKMIVTLLTVSLAIGTLGVRTNVAYATEVTQQSGIEINTANFPEPSVLTQAQSADRWGNNDGLLNPEEVKGVTSLNVNSDVTNIPKYLQFFPAVSYLSVTTGNLKSVTINEKITGMSIYSTSSNVVKIVGGTNLKNVTYNTTKKTALNFKNATGYSKVNSISVSGGKVTGVTLPNQANIENVYCSNMATNKLDVSKCKKLTSLQCYKLKIKKLNISANKKLEDLNVSFCKLNALDTSKNKKLERISIPFNSIKKLNLKKNTKLVTLNVSDNKLKKIDISKNKKLERLIVENNKLTSINLKKNTKLITINASGNALKSVNTTKNKNLYALDIGYNKIKSVNLTKNKKIYTLYVDGNKLKKLDLTKNIVLNRLTCTDNKLNKIKVAKDNSIFSIEIGGNKFKSFSLANYKKLTNFDVGESYSLLKNQTFNENLWVIVTLSKKKNHDMKKYLPKMKKYTFETLWGNKEHYTLTSAGKLKFTSKAKKLKKGEINSITLKIVNGTKFMRCVVRY